MAGHAEKKLKQNYDAVIVYYKVGCYGAIVGRVIDNTRHSAC